MRYEERLDAVLKNAAAVFARRGYHRASIREVAQAAGMSVAGLYYYCTSKEELLFAVSYHSFEILLRTLQQALRNITDPQEQLRRFILNHFEYFLTHMDAMKVVSHESGVLTGDLGARVAHIKRQYYLRGQEIIQAILGESDGDSPRLRILTLALFGMINWIYTWYRPDRDGDAKGLTDCMLELFLHGVIPQAAARPTGGDS